MLPQYKTIRPAAPATRTHLWLAHFHLAEPSTGDAIALLPTQDEVVELVKATVVARERHDDAALLSALEAFYGSVNLPLRYAEVVEILAFISRDKRTQWFSTAVHECILTPTSPAVLVAAAQVLFLLSWADRQQLADFFKPEQIDGVLKDEDLIHLIAKWYWRIWAVTENDCRFFPILLNAISILIDENYTLVSEKYACKFLTNALIQARNPLPPPNPIGVLRVFLRRNLDFFSDTFQRFNDRKLIYREFLASPDPSAVAAFIEFLGVLGSAGKAGMTRLIFDEIPIGAIRELVIREDGPPIVRAAFARMCGHLMTTDIAGCDFVAEFCAKKLILDLNAFADDDNAEVRLAAIKALTRHFGQFSRETQLDLLHNEFLEHLAGMCACLKNPSDAIRAVDEILDVMQKISSEDQARLMEVIHGTGIIQEIARVNDEEMSNGYDDEDVEQVREKWDAILKEVGFDAN
jgi:hypothetical protein